MELRKHHSHNILSRLAQCRSAVDSKRQQLTVKGLIEIGCTVKGLIGMGNFRISTLNCKYIQNKAYANQSTQNLTPGLIQFTNCWTDAKLHRIRRLCCADSAHC